MILRFAVFALTALGLLGFGLVVFIAARTPPASAGQPQVVSVLVAATPLRPGTLLHPTDIAAKKIARADLPRGAALDTAQARRDMAGAMVRRGLAQGDVLRDQDVMRPGDHGFLAAVLRPGMRAVTVGVDAVSGTAGLIWPGDHVDLILTEAINDSALPPARRIAALPVLTNVRVIAIDQDLVQGATPGAPAAHPARTVTLEVSAEQATRVQVAARLGHLSLAVRSAAPGVGVGVAATPGLAASTVWAGDVSPALSMRTTPVGPGVLHLYSGADKAQEFHF